MGMDHGCGATSPVGVHGARYYRFQDAGGRTHLVDSIDSVPQALRASAVCIEFGEQPDAASAVLPRGLTGLQTFGLGFGAALLVVLVFKKLPGTMRLLLRVAIVGGVVALLGGAYLGWVRRTTQQSNDVLAGPGAMIDDAKQAVAKMNARIQAEQAELKETEQGQAGK
jgi:hypothetical protein